MKRNAAGSHHRKRRISMPPYDVSQLLNMSSADLDALSAKSPARPIPNGAANGTAIVDSGKPVSKGIAAPVPHFRWQGTAFHAAPRPLPSSLSRLGPQA